MLTLNGLTIGSYPYSQEVSRPIGVLYSHEFPSTIVFEDVRDGNPIITEWVDCNDSMDRLFSYKITRGLLAAFINRNISHVEMIMSSFNGTVVLFDKRDGVLENIMVYAANKLPQEYLPGIDLFFDIELAVDVQEISDHFQLDQIADEISIGNISEMAKQEESDIINLHIKKGLGVGYGRIDSKTFSKSLGSFNLLYQEIALDKIYGLEESNLKTRARRAQMEATSTDIVLTKAASFSVFIRPSITDKSEYQDIRFGEIPKSLFFLLDASNNETALLENQTSFSDSVFSAYKEFLKTVNDSNLNLDINWANNRNESVLTESVTPTVANKTISYINKIKTESTRTFFVNGKFTLLNLKTKHFNFTSRQEHDYTGYFSSQISEGILTITFNKEYNLTIERKIIKLAGGASKIEDIIVSCLETEENIIGSSDEETITS